MTTPPNLPAPPAHGSDGFGGYVYPPDVQARVLNMLVDVSPFAASLARINTTSMEVVFPVAAPTGAAWVPELGRIPLMNLGDDADVVAVAKLAGLLDVSNESVRAGGNITTQMRGLLADSLAPQLDAGLLNGGGPPEPVGVIGTAPEAAGASLVAAVAKAKGEIADAGGAASTLAMSGTAMADADAATGETGALLYPGGFAAAMGLAPVVVPKLATALVYDARRLFTIINGQLSEVAVSTDYRFDYDATTFRVKARVACGCPVPAKAIRKLSVGSRSGQAAGRK